MSAEGCFFINIIKSKASKLGEAVQLVFILTQHFREEKFMKSLIKYFGCGNINQGRKKNPDGSKTFI